MSSALNYTNSCERVQPNVRAAAEKSTEEESRVSTEKTGVPRRLMYYRPANGSATGIDQVMDPDCFVEGVPAVIKKRNITDGDRLNYFGLLRSGWTSFEAENMEARIRKRPT
jgi:hypothetical protein